MKPTRSKAVYPLAFACGLSLVGLILVASNATIAGSIVNHSVGTSTNEEVFVSAGMFLMGCAGDLFPGGCDNDTKPVHGVYLDAFYIDRTEVTNAQYRGCVAAGVCSPPIADKSATRSNYFTDPRYDNYPMINVDWQRARAYCQWVGKRLPTEAEWEKAARGTDLRRYPWGNQPPTCALTNFKGCKGDTVAVGSYPEAASPYAALDMAGNVSEWVNDVYASRYYPNSSYYNPQGPGDTGKHLVRGGSWAEDQGGVTAFIRLDGVEILKYLRIGFRCAKGPTETVIIAPTPTLTPTPTPTPLPLDARTIGPDGGALWIAYPKHLTLLNVPPGVVDASTTFTVAFDNRSNLQGALQGNTHFFYLDTSLPLSGTGSTVIPPGSFRYPLKLTLGFADFGGVIPDTLDFYRLDSTGWLTTDIIIVERTDSHLVAWVGQTGTYGMLGKTNRIHLPIILRTTD